MQLTRFTDYSLRVLVFLGAHPDRLCTISETAEAYGISENHLMKVVNRLASAGYIETIRGKGGGMRLSRAPQMINLGDVVRRMEESFYIVECFDEEHQDCPLFPGCSLRSVLVDAHRNFMTTLDRYTLQDVLGDWVNSRFALAKARKFPSSRSQGSVPFGSEHATKADDRRDGGADEPKQHLVRMPERRRP